MVIELLLTALLSTLDFVVGLLPSDTIVWPDVSAIGPWVGGIVGPLDPILPVTELVQVMALMLTVVLPALLVYQVAIWIWTLLPIPGSG